MSLLGFALRLLPGSVALYVSMALVGVAITVGNVLLPAYIKKEYPRRAGPLSAVYTASLFIGPALAAAATIPLTRFFGSWHLAIASWGVLAVIAVPVWWPFAGPNGSSRAAAPLKEGMASAENERTAPLVPIWKSVLAWCVTFYFAVLSLLFYTISTWLPTILASQGQDIEVASQMLSVVNIVAIPFTLAVALAVHRLKRQIWATVGGAVLVIIGLFGILHDPGQHSIIYVIILGIGLGVEAGIGFSLPILRTSSPIWTASLAGMSQTVGYSFSALGPVGAGALHDMSGRWDAVLSIMIALVAVQSLFGIIAGSDRRVDRSENGGR